MTLLSYQHNSIRGISRLEQLPQLTILDMYSNNIQSLQSLRKAPALRGLMLGRNYLSSLDSQEVKNCSHCAAPVSSNSHERCAFAALVLPNTQKHFHCLR